MKILSDKELLAACGAITAMLRANPDCGATVVVHFSNGGGRGATLLPWRMTPRPVENVARQLAAAFSVTDFHVASWSVALNGEQAVRCYAVVQRSTGRRLKWVQGTFSDAAPALAGVLARTRVPAEDIAVLTEDADLPAALAAFDPRLGSRGVEGFAE